MGTVYFRIRNFDKFQHYKDRDPIWIKLYTKLLDNYEFSRLQCASKLQLILIWLLASKHDNRLPYDPDWIKGKICVSENVDLEVLLKGEWIETYEDASNTLAQNSNDASLRDRDRDRDREEGAADAALPKTDSDDLAPPPSAPLPAPPAAKPRAPRKPATGPHAELIQHHAAAWKKRYGMDYRFQDSKDGTAVGRILKACDGDLPKAKLLVSDYISDSDKFYLNSGHTLAILSGQINGVRTRSAKRHQTRNSITKTEVMDYGPTPARKEFNAAAH